MSKMIAEKQRNGTVRITIPWSVSDEQKNEMRNWCSSTFGPGGRNRRCNWRYGWIKPDNYIYIKNERMASIFVLQWS